MYKLILKSVLFFIAIILLQSCNESDDSTPGTSDEQTSVFVSSTLPGTYDVVFAIEEGTHVYQFNADNTVLINYEDDTMDTESWTINDLGQLRITGSVDDTFTITSGDQTSGNLDIILSEDEEDGGGYVNTTGTITLQ